MILNELSELYCSMKLAVYADGTNNRLAVGYTSESTVLRHMLSSPSIYNGMYLMTAKARTRFKFSSADTASDAIKYLFTILFMCDNVTVNVLSSYSKTDLGPSTVVYFSPLLSAFFPNRYPTGSLVVSSIGYFSHYYKTGTLGYVFADSNDNYSDYYTQVSNDDDDADEDDTDDDYVAGTDATDVSPLCTIVQLGDTDSNSSVSSMKGIWISGYRGRNAYSASASRYNTFTGDSPQVYASVSRFSRTARGTTCTSRNSGCTALTYPSATDSQSKKCYRLMSRGYGQMPIPIMGTHNASYVWQRMSSRTLCDECIADLTYKTWCQRLASATLSDEVYEVGYSNTSDILSQIRSNCDPFFWRYQTKGPTLASDLQAELSVVSSGEVLKAWNDADDEGTVQSTFSVAAVHITMSATNANRSSAYFSQGGESTTANMFPYCDGTGAIGQIKGFSSGTPNRFYAEHSLKYAMTSTDPTSVDRMTASRNKSFQYTNEGLSLYPIWSCGYGLCTEMCLESSTTNGYPLTISNVSTGTNTGTYYPTCPCILVGKKSSKKITLDSTYYKYIGSYAF